MRGKVVSRRAALERGWEGSRLEQELLAQAYERLEPLSPKTCEERRHPSGMNSAWPTS